MGAWDISFLFPAVLILQVAGLEEAKNLAGKCPPPDSDPRKRRRLWKNSRQRVKSIRLSAANALRAIWINANTSPQSESQAHRRLPRIARGIRDAHRHGCFY
jgi:hypothetical protein